MPDYKDISRRMDGAVENLRSEFANLRAGRLSAGILDNVQVEAYGQTMPLPQMATINMKDPRLLTVQVWDKAHVENVDRAIRKADLGLNPVVEGQLIRLPMPQLSEERRKELVKLAARASEQARIAVRNVRRDGMDKLKSEEKEIGKDEAHAGQTKVQELTDQAIKHIDAALADKEKEVMQV